MNGQHTAVLGFSHGFVMTSNQGSLSIVFLDYKSSYSCSPSRCFHDKWKICTLWEDGLVDPASFIA